MLPHVQGVGADPAVLRRSATLLSTSAQRRLSVSLEIPLVPGMDAPLVNRRAVQVFEMRIHSHHHAAETTGTNYSNSASDVLFSLVPAVGSDIKGRRCMFAHRTWRTTISLKSYRSNVNAEENVWTSTRSRHAHSFAHDRALFSALLAEVPDLALLGDGGRTVVYIARGIEQSQFRRSRWKQEIGSRAYGGWN